VLRNDGLGEFLVRSISFCWKSYLTWRHPERFASRTNLRLALKEYDRRSATMNATPCDLTIESTTRCNLSCVMCWHSFGTGIEPMDMPKLFLDMLADFMKRASLLQLHGNGEPLSSKAFWQTLDLASRYGEGARISINSNGQLLTHKIAGKLVRSPLHDITISLDAATHATYKKVRGADFDNVLENIRNLISARNKLGRKLPEVYVHMTLFRENIAELPAFIELAYELGVDKACFWHMNQDDDHERVDWRVARDGWVFNYHDQLTSKYPVLSNRMVRKALDRARELGLEIDTGARKQLWLPECSREKSEFDLEPPTKQIFPNEQDGLKDRSEVDCDAPWRWLVVGIDGTVRTCCHMTGPLGNLRHEDPGQIWNGHEMQSVRRSIKEKRLHRLCRGAACEYAHAYSGR
jgi:MoaA/NifB/PqqE/SkfB family radical SAM enzyme